MKTNGDTKNRHTYTQIGKHTPLRSLWSWKRAIFLMTSHGKRFTKFSKFQLHLCSIWLWNICVLSLEPCLNIVLLLNVTTEAMSSSACWHFLRTRSEELSRQRRSDWTGPGDHSVLCSLHVKTPFVESWVYVQGYHQDWLICTYEHWCWVRLFTFYFILAFNIHLTVL